MSNWKNVNWCLFFSPLNQSNAWVVFCHWFKPVFDLTVLFMFSRMVLLIFPISVLDGFISLHSIIILFRNVWFFKVSFYILFPSFFSSLFLLSLYLSFLVKVISKIRIKKINNFLLIFRESTGRAPLRTESCATWRGRARMSAKTISGALQTDRQIARKTDN